MVSRTTQVSMPIYKFTLHFLTLFASFMSHAISRAITINIIALGYSFILFLNPLCKQVIGGGITQFIVVWNSLRRFRCHCKGVKSKFLRFAARGACICIFIFVNCTQGVSKPQVKGLAQTQAGELSVYEVFSIFWSQVNSSLYDYTR